MDTNDKGNVSCRTLDLWSRNLKQKYLEMFENVNVRKNYNGEDQYVKVIFVNIENHSAML